MFDALRRDRSVLSIDLGHSAVKIARTVLDRNRCFEVRLADRQPLDREPDEDPYGPALRTLLHRNGIQNSPNVHLSLPTGNTIVRTVSLPPMGRKRVRQVMTYEASNHVPFEPETFVYDYQVIEQTTEQTRVLLCALKTEKYNRYRELLADVELTPVLAEVSAFSLFNLYQFVRETVTPSEREGDNASLRALVDMGSGRSDILLFKGQRLQFVRSASVGGDQITNAIARERELDWARAEEIKRQRGSIAPEESGGSGQQNPPAPGPAKNVSDSNNRGDQAATVPDIVRRNIRTLVGELRHTLDYVRSNIASEDVKSIEVCGGGSRFDGLPAFLEQEMSIPVRRFEPGLHVAGLDRSRLQDMLVCLGLQLRAEDEPCAIHLNLTEHGETDRKHSQEARLWRVAGGLGVLFLLLCGVLFYQNWERRVRHLEASERALSSLQGHSERYVRLRAELKRTKRIHRVIRNQERRRMGPLPFLKRLHDLPAPLRERTRIDHMEYSSSDGDSDRLVLAGGTGNFSDVSRIYRWFESMRFITGIVNRTQKERTRPEEDGSRTVVDFRVVFRVQWPEGRDGEQVTPGE